MQSAFDARNQFRCSHPCRRTEINGARWEYWAGGRGPRGMLVLGGLLSFGDTSHRMVSLFESTRKVISPTYPHLYRALEVVDGFARLLDIEGLDRVDVFGQGLGAGLAHLFVRRPPDR